MKLKIIKNLQKEEKKDLRENLKKLKIKNLD
jgi:hypothetical protein